MDTVTGQNVGIDISEDFLDVYLHPAGKEIRLPHDDDGTASLRALRREHQIQRVVLESTGGLQRRRVPSVPGAGSAVSVVNPERIWASRRLVGRVAKTDRIDARLIAEYGATMRPAARIPLSEAQQGMRELTSRRDQGLRISLGYLGALGKGGSLLLYSPAGGQSDVFCTIDRQDKSTSTGTSAP